MNNLNILLKNSPKFKTKIRSNKGIKIIVIHYTGMQSEVDALNIGIWHNLKQKNLINNRKKKILEKDKLIFFKFLKKIGFQTRFNIKKSKYQKKLIEAFQRRFRPELISGIVDKECFFIAKNLSL